MKKIVFGLIALVLLEIATFILVGNKMGVLYTLFLILLTSVVGLFIAKRQGLQSFQNIRNSIENGVPPGIAMIDTFLIFIGGILIVLPGFLTDLMGLTLVVPIVRNVYHPMILNWIRKKLKNGQVIVIQR